MSKIDMSKLDKKAKEISNLSLKPSLTSSPNCRPLFFAVALIGILALAGCGGGGGGTTITNSPFAGTWAGTYTAPTLSQNGTASITISSSGVVAGTGHNNTSGINFNINGNIDNSGNINGNITGGYTQTLSGTLAISGTTGHLAGAVTASSGAGSYVNNFDLIKQ